MGREGTNTTVYVGLARLPQPPVAPASTVAVELEVGGASRRIVTASCSLQLPALERLLHELLVDQAIDAVEDTALPAFEGRYSAPFATAVRAALLAAVRRAAPGAPGGNGHSHHHLVPTA